LLVRNFSEKKGEEGRGGKGMGGREGGKEGVRLLP